MEVIRDTLAALRFFTRLPVPGDHDVSRSLSASAMGFPLAGLIIGILLAIVWLLASLVLPAFPAAGLAIVLGLLVTGALHEDGLSDCADGLGGTQDRERALEIMRDSRIGAYGAAALIASIGLRWTALAEMAPWAGAAAIIIAHSASRAAIVPALALSSYARKEGLGQSVADGISHQTMWIILAVSALLALLCGGLAGLVAAVAGLGLSRLFLMQLERRLGGYTGDGLGAMQQIAEITILLVCSAFWG